MLCCLNYKLLALMELNWLGLSITCQIDNSRFIIKTLCLILVSYLLVYLGAILGPPLFVIIVNNMPSTVSRRSVMMYDTVPFFTSLNVEEIEVVLRN